MVQLQESEACSKKRACLFYFCFLRMCLALKMNVQSDAPCRRRAQISKKPMPAAAIRCKQITYLYVFDSLLTWSFFL